MVPGNRWKMYLEPFEGRTIQDEYGDLCNRPAQYDTVMVHLIAPYFPLWRAREPEKKLIGVTVWETDRLMPGSMNDLQHLDGLIVPCRWNERVFHEKGVACPIHVAPHVHHESEDVPQALDLPGVSEDDFVFYTIGDWKDRKGMHLTLESFCRAFNRRDPVVLVIKTGQANERRKKGGFWYWHIGRHIETSVRDIARILEFHKEPPRVVALTQKIPAAQMRDLHHRGDCYVSLTHTEGWGLGAYEAAFAGKPVIMTGYGGQLDFLPGHLSHHVDFRIVPARPEGQIDASYKGHFWAEPNLDHGAQLMREVFSHRAEARERGRALQAFVRAEFVAERIAQGMLDFADNIG